MGSLSRRRYGRVLLRVLPVLLIVGLFAWITINRQLQPPQLCNVPEAFTDKLHEIAYRSHVILAKLGLVHFLCFDSLWGQARTGRALPWARKVELCLVDTLRDDTLILRAFRQADLSATYLHAAGIYHVQERDVADDGPRVEIVVFEDDELAQMVRRVGWTRRVLPPDCEISPSLQCFPPQLAFSPLPVKQFGGYIMPVPREGIELQKYHYPDNWWLELKPTNCMERTDS